MINLKMLAVCTVMAAAAFSGSAQAQQINIQSSADSGTQAEVARVRAFGNSQPSTWTPSINTQCSSVNVNSVNSGDNGLGRTVDQLNPGVTASNAVTQRGPLKMTTVTGKITNICIQR